MGMSDEEISRINEAGMTSAGNWHRANGAPPQEPQV